MKVIFLDIDGVLNGYNQLTGVVYFICKKLHLQKWLSKHYDIFGVHENKVRRLAKIVKKTGAKIVISSLWRRGWLVPYEEKTDDHKLLHDLFLKYNIEVIDITGKVASDISTSHREYEIREWLEKHGQNVERFVVLDDEIFDLKGFVGKELIQTSESDYIKGHWHENTGLKRKHVKQAIKLLNA